MQKYRELHTSRYHFAPIRLETIENLPMPVSELRGSGLARAWLVRSPDRTTLTEWNLAILSKLYMYLPFDPEIPLLEMYPEDILPKVRKYIRRPLLVVAWFVLVKYGKEPKCPHRGEGLKKVMIEPHSGALCS